MELRFPLHRRYPISSDFEAHKNRTPPSSAPGTDFAAPKGTPVFAIARGIVEVAEGRGAGGLRCWINHGKDARGRVIKSYYAHLSSLEVVKLQVLATGDKIGEVGSTGHSTGPHLHWSLKLDGEWVDPLQFLG